MSQTRMFQTMRAVGLGACFMAGVMGASAAGAQAPSPPRSGRRQSSPERPPETLRTESRAGASGCFVELMNPEQPAVKLRIEGPILMELPARESTEWGPGCNWCIRNCMSTPPPIGRDLFDKGVFRVSPEATLELYSGEQGAGRAVTLHGSEQLRSQEKPFQDIRSLRVTCTPGGPGEQPAPRR